MGLWLIALGLSFVDAYVAVSQLYLEYPVLSGLFSGSPLVHGPFCWLYTVFILKPSTKWQWKQLLHFVPLLAYYIHGSLTFFSASGPEKIALMQGIEMGEIPVYIYSWGIAKALHGLVYMLPVLRLLNRFEQESKNHFSNPNRLRIKWLKVLTLSLLGIFGLAIINNVLVHLYGLNMEFVLALCSALLILGGGFFAMKQPALFKPEKPKPEIQEAPIDTSLDELKQKVEAYMNGEKPFLNPDFTLQDFSDGLGLPSKELSRVLNQGFGINFFAFVNQYRVNEVVARLKDPEHDKLTLLGIAFDCGFNSKTTFNTSFKKQTGQTPSEFKKNLNT